MDFRRHPAAVKAEPLVAFEQGQLIDLFQRIRKPAGAGHQLVLLLDIQGRVFRYEQHRFSRAQPYEFTGSSPKFELPEAPVADGLVHIQRISARRDFRELQLRRGVVVVCDGYRLFVEILAQQLSGMLGEHLPTGHFLGKHSGAHER